MAVPSDFTEEELDWLGRIRRSVGEHVPAEVRDKLISYRVADDTPLGLRITGLGNLVLSECENEKAERGDRRRA
jgi:hypothetical protein